LQSDRLYVRSQLFQARIKANDVVQEHLKQIITVASAALALTVTFLKDVLGNVADKLEWSGLLPTSWVCLGLCILMAVLSLAFLVNNLDSAGQNPRRAFQAGGRLRVQLPVLLTFLVFGIGMLFLGIFAARNFENLIRFQKSSYKVASASSAVELASNSLKRDANELVGAVEKVELVPGIAGSVQSLPVWHVQLRMKEPVPPTPSTMKTSGEDCVRKGRKLVCPKPDAVPATQAPPEARRIDFFIDAEKGAVFRVPGAG